MLKRRWFPFPSGLNRGFLESIGDWMEMNSELRDRPELHELTWRLYSEASDGLPMNPADAELASKAAEFVRELRTVGGWIGLMERAFYGADLEHHNSHPINRGWNAAYRRWAEDPTFRRYWPILRGEFSRRLVDFCEDELNLGIEIELTPIEVDPVVGIDWELDWLDAAYRMEFQAPEGATRTQNVRYESIKHVVRRSDGNAWMIRWKPLDDGGDTRRAPLRKACGVIAVVPDEHATSGHAPEIHELFIWIHGCHRNLQIGRSAFCCKLPMGRQDDKQRQLFDLKNSMEGHVISTLLKRSTSVELRVYLPQTQREETRSGDLRAMWYAFFTPYGFRRAAPSANRSQSEAEEFEVLVLSSEQEADRRSRHGE